MDDFIRQPQVDFEDFDAFRDTRPMYTRGKRWRTTELRNPQDRIVIPDIGDIGPLGALYRDTPLFPGDTVL